jgi:[ribosomal protein S18]-alanine N-acetyltransferase
MFGLFEKPIALTVQRLGVEHSDDCTALHAASFAHAWPQTEMEELLLSNVTQAHGAFAARGVLAGFILCRVAADEAEILTIAVAPKWRGEGVATRLMNSSLEALAVAGARSLFLEVETGNTAALALYKRFAFKKVGERVAYYRKPNGTTATALIMKRSIG